MKQYLFNPFIKVAGLKAFAIGTVFVAIAVLLAWQFNTKFDGVLNVHYGGASNLQTHALMMAVNIVSLVAVFYPLAMVLTKNRTRFVDILGTMTLACFPLVLAPLLNIGNYNSVIGDKIARQLQQQNLSFSLTTFDYVFLIACVVLIMLIIVWHVALLYRAYTVSTNLKGTKAVISFIGGLLVSSILSIFLIYLL